MYYIFPYTLTNTFCVACFVLFKDIQCPFHVFIRFMYLLLLYFSPLKDYETFILERSFSCFSSSSLTIYSVVPIFKKIRLSVFRFSNSPLFPYT